MLGPSLSRYLDDCYVGDDGTPCAWWKSYSLCLLRTHEVSNGVWANISVQLFFRKNYSIFWNCTSSMHQFSGSDVTTKFVQCFVRWCSWKLKCSKNWTVWKFKKIDFRFSRGWRDILENTPYPKIWNINLLQRGTVEKCVPPCRLLVAFLDSKFKILSRNRCPHREAAVISAASNHPADRTNRSEYLVVGWVDDPQLSRNI